MDIKKCLPISLLVLAGCTTTATMDKNTLNSMKIDCRHKDEQIAFLRSQYPSETDRITNSLMIRSTLGFIASNADGTYNERRGMDNGSYTSAIRLQIYNIEKTCAAY